MSLTMLVLAVPPLAAWSSPPGGAPISDAITSPPSRLRRLARWLALVARLLSRFVGGRRRRHGEKQPPERPPGGKLGR
ncbi:MAG: hypothetical protein M1582_05110 [Actinobacteria bacterium]|nr:hypothetical protein [Actinomycetota bacterium]